ncbi:spore coat protein U domain-containing protein [Ralstonia solanacearum]|uniref:spore coat protein U domain-containing protein n=1 Tax=Ralstonia solanacearum TaxID=305 RepID=UPI0009BDE330|nr:spore coat protein U domain-containing protein [Ralstonia solanacearum]
MTRFPNTMRPRRASARTLLAGAALAALASWAPDALAVSCTVTANALSFGAYNTLSNLTGTTTVTITCGAWAGSNSISYTLTASAGSGTYANRQLLAGSNVIAYNLYTTSADTSIWGDGNGDGTVTLTGTVTKQQGTVNLTIYGNINGGQNVVPGSYATTVPITVTLTYQ